MHSHRHTAAGRFVAAVLCALAGAGCERPSGPAPEPLKDPSARDEPIIRVRLRRQIASIHVQRPASIHVTVPQDSDRLWKLRCPVVIQRDSGRWIGPWEDDPPPDRSTLVIKGLGPDPLGLAAADYPGVLHLVPLDDGATFDLINHTPLESYLPGVVSRELPERWAPAAQLAQAIAARSYALAQMIRQRDARHYDVVATQHDQVYGGLTDRGIALKAVADTGGLVLSYGDRVLPAYYASTCGGTGQSAFDAFASEDNMDPLNPTARDRPWCRRSPFYRWGPVRRDRPTLSRRLAAWGAARNLPLKNLDLIEQLQVSRTNAADRPTRFLLEDRRGQRYEMRAESLRVAANFYTAAGPVERPPKGTRLISSHFRTRVEGSQVIFEDGRGLGHGVGLCQYGADRMARTGHHVLEILEAYYPGAAVQRAY